MASSYDVIIIGLGGMGSAAAYHLAGRGQRVLGLEQFTPAHDRGSSHGGSRLIRQAYFEDPAYVPLLRRSFELWTQLQHHSDQEIVTLTGGVMLGRPGSRVYSGSARSAAQWGLSVELLDATQVRERFPTLTPDEDEVALYEPNAGFVRPERTVATQLDLARRGGAELRFGKPVRSWRADRNGRGVAVTTDDGTVTAGRLVITPGAWAPRMLTDLGLPLVVERQVMYWFAPEGGAEPFSAEHHPVYIWEGADGEEFYGFPAHDGSDGGAKVAFFRRGIVCTPDTLDCEVHASETEAMRDYLRPRIPTLPGPLLRAAACMYTTSPDQHFVVGLHPEYPQVSIACGFSGHGFKFVPLVGEVLADLATDGNTRHPIHPLFDPIRPTLTSIPTSTQA